MLSQNSEKLKLNAIILVSSIVAAAIIPFVLPMIKEVPIISLCLGQMALIFLLVLAAFPKANYQDIIRLSTSHLMFVVIAFTVLSFLPFEANQKLFHFADFEGWFPSMVHTNLIPLIFLNIAGFVYLSLNFVEGEEEEVHEIFKQPVHDPLAKVQESNEHLDSVQMSINSEAQQDPIEELSMISLEDHKEETIQEGAPAELSVKSSELQEAVDNLFDIYLDDDDFESEEVYSDEKLEQLENTLLDNLDYNIDGALCLNTEGKQLDESVFKWDGPEREELISVFAAYNEASKNSGTGRLCQFLLNEGGFWYMVARFRGNFLVLKAELEEPTPLLETGYKVFRQL